LCNRACEAILQPLLIFDGDCGFCRYCVDYARSVTGDAVDYKPYQSVRDAYPEIPEDEFKASIQLMDGRSRHQGADAAFRVLAKSRHSVGHLSYRWVPGFARIAEAGYRWVSRHRGLCFAVAKVLFGRRLKAATYAHTADLLYRGIALAGLLAFVSLWVQIQGLVGSGGVLPAGELLDWAAGRAGAVRYYHLPTVFWLSSSDFSLHLVCAAGSAAALVALLGKWRLTSAVVGYVAYLSLVSVGQAFMAFQWDMLLLECFVVAVVLCRSSRAGVWLARLLLFRFMFLSGVVKLSSGDSTWADGTALSYHFETQPLPTVVAWFAHQLPAGFLSLAATATLVIELLVPFALFLPRNPRLVAAGSFVLLELLIALTGSYNFFNMLTIMLCFSVLDDRLLVRLWPWRSRPRSADRSRMAASVAVALGILGLGHVANAVAPHSAVTVVRASLLAVQPFGIVNRYGVFAVMTTERNEIVVEGSLDGNLWQVYEFPYKPGSVDRAPRLATPHQPRLDWQMWFAALGSVEQSPWFYGLVDALLRADPAVLALVNDPFAGARPRFVRARLYRYQFATPELRRAGRWWRRELLGEWLAPARRRVPRITYDPLVVE
jgi:predicted DCC family thiol-disulfide oxidoreductase YuxK